MLVVFLKTMNKNHEITKLLPLLGIPINDIIFKGSYVDVISGQANIGGIPYYTLAGILKYDTAEGIVNRLRWEAIYDENKEQINILLFQKYGNDITVTLGTFRRLYIRDEKGNLRASVLCTYDQEWKIFQE